MIKEDIFYHNTLYICLIAAFSHMAELPSNHHSQRNECYVSTHSFLELNIGLDKIGYLGQVVQN